MSGSEVVGAGEGEGEVEDEASDGKVNVTMFVGSLCGGG